MPKLPSDPAVTESFRQSGAGSMFAASQLTNLRFLLVQLASVSFLMSVWLNSASVGLKSVAIYMLVMAVDAWLPGAQRSPLPASTAATSRYFTGLIHFLCCCSWLYKSVRHGWRGIPVGRRCWAWRRRSAFCQRYWASLLRINCGRVSSPLVWMFAAKTVFLLVLILAMALPLLVFCMLQSLIAVTLLEAVNYIEHYGLLRRGKDSRRIRQSDNERTDWRLGRREPFGPMYA